LGALRFAARDPWRGPTVGVLPQRLHLSADLSVADNLALVYRAAGLPVDWPAIDELLGALGIEALRDRRPSALSGGQAQRVALARALLRRPALLLADEPTASLDDTACAQALALLHETAQRAGATLVVATHDARALVVFHGAAVLALEPTGAAA
jgi:putative ABC transport system ATP-binding protein